MLELREELGWVGGALGAVRDLDVQLEQLDEWLAEAPGSDLAALSALRSLLEEQRRAARATMLEALDSSRYASLVSRFGRMLRVRPQRRPAAASLPARAVAPDLIERRFRRFRKAAKQIGPESTAAEYHRLRIRGKRLRYTLEFLAELYPGRTRPLIRRLAALQDILGRHQDAEVAIDRLRQLAAGQSGELPPETLFAMGEIAERHRQTMRELRARFPSAYKRVHGKRWKSFRKLIERKRPASPAPAPADAPAGAPPAGPQGTR